MAPIPVVVRERILTLYEQGKKTKVIAGAVGYCRAAVRRVRQRHRERVTVRPKARPVRTGLTEAVLAELRGLVAKTPDATLGEPAADLSAAASPSTVDRWLTKLDLTLEKSRTGPRSRTART